MVIFDLDGTLSVVGDRIKYIQQDPKDWIAFYDACDQDEVNKPIAGIYRALLIEDYEPLKIITGRRESVRQKTLDWLESYGLYIDSKDLHMRPDGDFRCDTLLKPELAAPFLSCISLVFEDRSSMVKKWRELGICCCQVAKGDF